MSESGSRTGEAVWKRPAWIAAIVTLISAFLTIPEIIGDYFSKKQDIELAREKTKTVEVANIDLKQEQEFKIVTNTLAKQGTERVFVLRYLAATLDDEPARAWAQGEVNRLDNLAALREQLTLAEEELDEKEKQLAITREEGVKNTQKVESEIQALRQELAKRNSEIELSRQQAGIADSLAAGSQRITFITIVEALIDANRPLWADENVTVQLLTNKASRSVTCKGPEIRTCKLTLAGAPRHVEVQNYHLVASVSGTLLGTIPPNVFRSETNVIEKEIWFSCNTGHTGLTSCEPDISEFSLAASLILDSILRNDSRNKPPAYFLDGKPRPKTGRTTPGALSPVEGSISEQAESSSD